MVSDNLGANVAYAATFNGEQDIYFLRIGPWDCNGNEIVDALDISELRSRDCNTNQVPDECEYRADINGDGLTTLPDFAAFQKALTGPGVPIPDDCTRLLDPDHDNDIDLHDSRRRHFRHNLFRVGQESDAFGYVEVPDVERGVDFF